MSIEIVSNNHYDKLKYILSNIKEEIKIVSPFIKDEMANELCNVLSKNKDVNCTIITRFVRNDFSENVSSLNALEILIDSGAKIYALRNLHAKLYLVDDVVNLIGSANFTSGGFKFNHELSLLIEDEDDINSSLQLYFDNVLAEIKSQDESEITKELIRNEQKCIREAKKSWKDKKTKYGFSEEKQYGAIIENKNYKDIETRPDVFQEILINSKVDACTDYCWLKFEGRSEQRKNPNEVYSVNRPEGYNEGVTCFPINKKPSGIKEDEVIYLAVLTSDNEGNNIPVIVGRCTSYGYEEKNIASKEMIAKFDWMKKYPAFIRFKDIEYLLTEHRNGVSLMNILNDVGVDAYPTTVGTCKPFPELRAMHYRRSHMKITNKASEYIDNEFEKLAQTYGTNKRPLNN